MAAETGMPSGSPVARATAGRRPPARAGRNEIGQQARRHPQTFEQLGIVPAAPRVVEDRDPTRGAVVGGMSAKSPDDRIPDETDAMGWIEQSGRLVAEAEQLADGHAAVPVSDPRPEPRASQLGGQRLVIRRRRGGRAN